MAVATSSDSASWRSLKVGGAPVRSQVSQGGAPFFGGPVCPTTLVGRRNSYLGRRNSYLGRSFIRAGKPNSYLPPTWVGETPTWVGVYSYLGRRNSYLGRSFIRAEKSNSYLPPTWVGETPTWVGISSAPGK